ncbi:CODH nickel-insertion accessory protein [Methanolacinia petrolearia DSM 11571]|uniref:CODH nickel-insertion accessory protein n=1 Tax=Methanolacinia petrolearia (strain DSM 11571 / OCM 486 / SEBR 4847) TaxID=679926 RepID=E1RH60_METP4|nr:ArsA-related P-loop ATPase [Methanolacinia petrolearia]ADN35284.1 CODH nickel-insertion accessory protein [Methanolacinia petrolearia DSM 11571]
MKIVICGKGGSGKSTIVALMAHEYARQNKNVLVVDTDESNMGLHSILGNDSPADLMKYFGGKPAITEKIMAAMPDPSKVKIFENTWTFEDLPKEYVSYKNGIRLIAIGKIHDFGEGCACPMGILANQFLENLSLGEDDIVITDTEAGIEHFGRGIDRHADFILLVLDPSNESIRLAEKISGMTKDLEIPLYFILNKTDPEISSIIKEQIVDPSLLIGEIPGDDEILKRGLRGVEMDIRNPYIEKITESLSSGI